MSELYMDMQAGTKEDRILAAINNMRDIKGRMHSQPGKHESVQVLHLNDCVSKLAEALELILQITRKG